jgi:uncharacterized membrane protein YebE (DUF533 family)
MPPVSFDASEAQAIIRALAAVAVADGAILDREESFLEGFAVANGMSTLGVGAHALGIDTPLDERSLAAAVRDPHKRREVIALCLEMAHRDREYAASEREIITRIARAFELTDGELTALTAAVKRD